MTAQREKRRAVIRIVGLAATLVATCAAAVVSKPGWREYFAEGGIVVGALIFVRLVAASASQRFRSAKTSPFEWALLRDTHRQTPPSQLLNAASMASAPERSTVEFFTSTFDRRLHARYGFGFDDQRASDTVGAEIYELLRTAARSTSPSNTPTQTRQTPFGPQPRLSPDHVRIILNRLEQL